MRDGDDVRCFVEGCGTLVNSVRDEAVGQVRVKAKL